MKNMKKIFATLLTFAMVISNFTTVFASTREEDEQKSTTLYLKENEITQSGNRHIKVTWDKVTDANAYILEIADNEEFENATRERSIKRGLYWNFSDIDGEQDATYYIRIQPCFYYGTDENGEYVYTYGQWSNVIEAIYEKEELDPDKEIEAHFPWKPFTINWELFSKFNWGM